MGKKKQLAQIATILDRVADLTERVDQILNGWREIAMTMRHPPKIQILRGTGKIPELADGELCLEYQTGGVALWVGTKDKPVQLVAPPAARKRPAQPRAAGGKFAATRPSVPKRKGRA